MVMAPSLCRFGRYDCIGGLSWRTNEQFYRHASDEMARNLAHAYTLSSCSNTDVEEEKAISGKAAAAEAADIELLIGDSLLLHVHSDDGITRIPVTSYEESTVLALCLFLSESHGALIESFLPRLLCIIRNIHKLYYKIPSVEAFVNELILRVCEMSNNLSLKPQFFGDISSTLTALVSMLLHIFRTTDCVSSSLHETSSQLGVVICCILRTLVKYPNVWANNDLEALIGSVGSFMKLCHPFDSLSLSSNIAHCVICNEENTPLVQRVYRFAISTLVALVEYVHNDALLPYQRPDLCANDDDKNGRYTLGNLMPNVYNIAMNILKEYPGFVSKELYDIVITSNHQQQQQHLSGFGMISFGLLLKLAAQSTCYIPEGSADIILNHLIECLKVLVEWWYIDPHSCTLLLCDCVDALRIIGISFAHLNKSALDAVRSLLTDPCILLVSYPQLNFPCNFDVATRQLKYGCGTGAATNDVCAALRDYTLAALIDILHSGISYGNIDITKSLIASFANRIYTLETSTVNEVKLASETLNGVVHALGCVACASEDDRMKVDAISVLNRYLSLSHTTSDCHIVEQMGLIGASGGVAFIGVLDIFVHILKQQDLPENEFALPAVLIAMVHMCRSQKTMEGRFEIFMALLHVFHQKAWNIQRQASSPPEAIEKAQLLGYFLPALGELSKSIHDMDPLCCCPQNVTASPSVLSVFKDVWYHCVMFGLVSATDRAWRHGLAQLAVVTPVLIEPIEGELCSLQATMQHHGEVHRSSPFINILPSLRSSLIAVTTSNIKSSLIASRNGQTMSSFSPQNATASSQSVTAIINRLGLSEVSVLLCLHNLECVRVAQAADIRRTFMYIESSAFFNDVSTAVSDLEVVVRLIIDSVFNTFLDVMTSADKTTRDAELANHMQFLLINFNHRHARVKLAADEYILCLVNRFPHVLWDHAVLRNILNVLERLARTLSNSMRDGIDILLSFPGTSYTLIQASDVASREASLLKYLHLCKRLLRLAQGQAPSQIQLLLQDYMLHIGHIVSGLSHDSGVAMAVDIADFGLNPMESIMPSGLLLRIPEVTKGMTAVFTSSLSLKNRHIGAIEGMAAVFAISGESLAERLLIALRSATVALTTAILTQDTISGADMTRLDDSFSTAMYNIAAAITSKCNGIDIIEETKLLHAMMVAPIDVFSVGAMKSGIFCWGWLAVARPELESRVLVEMAAAWSVALQRCIGLFDTSVNIVNPLYASVFNNCGDTNNDSIISSVDARFISACQAHELWITYLTDRYHATFCRDSVCVTFYLELLQSSFCITDNISKHVSAHPSRFLLLTLGLAVLQNQYINDILDVHILRHRIYSAALHTYTVAPAFPRPTSAARRDAELRLHIFALMDFAKALTADKRAFKAACAGLNSAQQSHLIDIALVRRDHEDENIFAHNTVGSSGIPSDNCSYYLPKPKRPKRRAPASVLLNIDSDIDTVNSSWLSEVNNDMNDAACYTSKGPFRSVSTQVFKKSPHLIGGDCLTLNSSINGGYSSHVATKSHRLDASINEGLATGSSRSDMGSLGRLSSMTGVDNNGAIIRDLRRRRNLILLLMRHDIDRLCSWLNPNGSPDLRIADEDKFSGITNITDKAWREYVRVSWNVSPSLAIQLALRFPMFLFVRTEVECLVRANVLETLHLPEALAFFVNEKSISSNLSELSLVPLWADVPPIQAIAYFSQLYTSHPMVEKYATRVLRKFPPEVILFYIPQLVQALRYDSHGLMWEYVIWAASHSQLMAHQFIWNMRANSYINEDSTFPDSLKPTLDAAIATIMDGLSGTAKEFFECEFDFFNQITSISGTLKPIPKPDRKRVCLEELAKINVPFGVYLPSNVEAIVVGLDYNSGTPMQSAMKAPFLVTFHVKSVSPKELENFTPAETANSDRQRVLSERPMIQQSAIFKVGDDVRQDMLALQVIALFKKIFDQVGLPLYLFPYKVVATSPGCGVIEVVPCSKSRGQLGHIANLSLYEYFLKTHGNEDTLGFQRVRSNFIQSMAAYSVFTYLLQIKDRHNGNILVDDAGHLIHIDFGFMFESSPGGNLGFEPDFKLTLEFVQIMGGDMDAAPFRWFCDLCAQAFVALRPYQESIVNLVAMMLDTSFPCFRGSTIKLLRSRFAPKKSDREASKFMIKKVRESYLNFRTNMYDRIQFWTQDIPY